MDVKIYLEGSEPDKFKTDLHKDVMEYAISDDEKTLHLIFKNGEKKQISLSTVNRVLAIRPKCIYHKDKGSFPKNNPNSRKFAKSGA